MTTEKKDLVTTVAYLIGVKEYFLNEYFEAECHDLLEKLRNDQNASTIRYLCKLRVALMQNFRATDQAMRYDFKNLNTLEYYDHDEIHQLEKWGIPIIKVNYRAEKYMEDICTHISNNISKCSNLFFDWQRFDYIKELFRIPGYKKTNILQKEFDLYMANMDLYPFKTYIHWHPIDCGNLLQNDEKFMKILFSMHNDTFQDRSKCRDANEEVKNNIYDFISDSEKTAIVVDCENSDAYKFMGVLRNLNSEQLAKIEKITLYDDKNTSSSWDWIANYTDIPVEHIEVERVCDQKSLVDVRMTSGVCMDFYTKGITSFILLSSDSDYWALISSLPDANFLVMYEYSKCSPALKDMLEKHSYYYCAIDDFCSGNTEDFKKRVLFETLKSHLPDISSLNGKELARKVHEETFTHATEKEIQHFFERYIKNLKLKIDDNGKMQFEFAW